MTRKLKGFLMLLATALVASSALADGSPLPAALIVAKIDYRFVGHQEETDDG